MANPRRQGVLKALGLIGVGLGCSCVTVPETGRRDLILISPHEEIQLGLAEFQKIKESTPVSTNAALQSLVSRVGQRIASVAALPHAQWEFVLFEDPKTANAFCLPGGKVGVFTGLLPYTEDETGLAVVIGHEVAHAVARHGASRLSRGLLVQFGGQLLAEAMQTDSQAARHLILMAYGVGAQLGLILPYSRDQEFEADHIGLLYMARAGYDPSTALSFWKRFSAKGGSRVPRGMAFLSTHPVDEERIAKLETILPRAMEEYRSKVAQPGAP